MRYAKIENEKVVNVIVLNDEDLPLMPEDWVLVKSDTANIGDDYINGVFIVPAPVYIEQPVQIRKIPAIDFKLRFTIQERVAIYASVDPIVKDFCSLLDDPRLQNVDLDLSTTVDAINYLVNQNLITQARADEILA